MQLRLDMTDFHLRAEVSHMRTMCSLRKAKAGKEEIKIACQNVREASQENCEILRMKCQSKYLKILEIEKTKQENAILDYEGERYTAIINDSKNNLLMQIQMSTCFVRIKGEIREVLYEKQKIVENDLNERSVSNEIKILSMKQIEAEADREEFELKSVYFSLIIGVTVSERFVTEMVEGFSPSFSYAKECESLGFFNESELLLQALKKDFLHKKCLMKIITSNIHKNFEENRLCDLDRSPDDLVKIHAEIDKRLKIDLKNLNEDFLKEKNELEIILLSQYNNKKKNLSQYENEISTIVEEHKTKLNDLKSTHSADKLRINDKTVSTEKVEESSTDVREEKVRMKILSKVFRSDN